MLYKNKKVILVVEIAQESKSAKIYKKNDENEIVFEYDAGDYRYHLIRDNNMYYYAESERSNSPRIHIFSKEIEYVLRWLLIMVGSGYRGIKGYPFFFFPFKKNQINEEYTPIELPDRNVTLMDSNGFEFPFAMIERINDIHDLVKYSYLVPYSIEDLVLSYRNFNGFPCLFSVPQGYYFSLI